MTTPSTTDSGPRLDDFALEEAALAMHKACLGPGLEHREAARIAVEAYLAALRAPVDAGALRKLVDQWRRDSQQMPHLSYTKTTLRSCARELERVLASVPAPDERPTLSRDPLDGQAILHAPETPEYEAEMRRLARRSAGRQDARGEAAWIWVEDARELKECPHCHDYALEGESVCSSCECEPADDETWRNLRRAALAAPGAEPEREPEEITYWRTWAQEAVRLQAEAFGTQTQKLVERIGELEAGRAPTEPATGPSESAERLAHLANALCGALINGETLPDEEFAELRDLSNACTGHPELLRAEPGERPVPGVTRESLEQAEAELDAGLGTLFHDTLAEMQTTLAARAAPQGDVREPLERMGEIVDFLCGKAPLHDLWFGESDPKKVGAVAGRPRVYWWRDALRERFDALARLTRPALDVEQLRGKLAGICASPAPAYEIADRVIALFREASLTSPATRPVDEESLVGVLDAVDDDLARIEDIAHGDIGELVTRLRAKIHKALGYAPELARPVEAREAQTTEDDVTTIIRLIPDEWLLHAAAVVRERMEANDAAHRLAALTRTEEESR